MAGAKTDLKREIPTYTAPRGRFETVTVQPQRFLMLDGAGDPNTSEAYASALRTIYPVAYALKFLSRDELGRDYTVMPLEALWWAEDLAAFTSARDKSRWRWTVMILTPEWLTDDHVQRAVARVAAKRSAPFLDDLRCDAIDEGLVVQTLHVGPYEAEGPVLRALHDDHLPAEGLRPTGHHHEIYLSDARRVAPARLRTILRQPVAPQPA